ncbi:MAG TPA: 30S ribosomal protein S11 [Spirochaetota bacterium]|nr:30S ribosomal protein S11 [Spirochaetota bacterium]
MAKKDNKKKVKKAIPKGIVHIKNTFNNTIVTISDPRGNVIAWSSAGALKFRGAKKSTPYASQIVTNTVCEEAKKSGLKEVTVYVRGPGFGREAAIRAVGKAGIVINRIKDVTGIPHNGCRAKKQRRV